MVWEQAGHQELKLPNSYSCLTIKEGQATL